MITKHVCKQCGNHINPDRLAVLDTNICEDCARKEPGNIMNQYQRLNEQPNQLEGWTIRVHDHGFVRYVEHMGTDLSIVEAARVSYHSPSKGDDADKKLLGYLLRNKHTSPFEMCKIKFNIKMPIFVMRQYIRHRMQNVNEVSARYTQLPEEFFIPEIWRKQDTKNKQGSVHGERDNPDPFLMLDDDVLYDVLTPAEVQLHDGMPTASQAVSSFYSSAYTLYEKLLTAGVAREQARIVLPVGIYTEFYCCWDLNNLLKYFALRDDPHAQGEHQDYAKAMKQITAKFFPWTMELYESTRINTRAA